MTFPIEILFRNMTHSDFIWNDVWDHTEKLQRFFDRIMSCRVTISAPHHHRRNGNVYVVQIDLRLPGEDLNITNEHKYNPAHKDVYVAIRDAFEAAKRKLEDLTRKKRHFVKTKNVPMHGKVKRIFPNEDCGFITTPDRRELYFHKNSVLNNEFDKLEIGDEVRFSEEIGEKGPQVTSMTRVGRSGHLRTPI